MNGMMALMPMMQPQNFTKQSAVKQQESTDFKNFLDHKFADSMEGINLELLDGELFTETDLVELLSQLTELVEDGEINLGDLISSLSSDAIEQMLNSLEELLTEIPGILDDLDYDLLNTLGELLAELHFDLQDNVKNESNEFNMLDLSMNNQLPIQGGAAQGNDVFKQLEQVERMLSRVVANLVGHQQANQQGQNQLNERWSQLVQQIRSKVETQNQQTSQQFINSIKQLLPGLLSQGNSGSEQSTMLQRNGDFNFEQLNMSKLEQFTVHVSRANSSQSSQMSNQQQIIEQLQKIIQSTQFGRANGTNNLTIQLKPANLGQMTLQFTQIDGQMAVKISVMSTAAKEMLESNLNQLRHLFHPNQVVIERQVDQTNTDFTKQQLKDDSEESDEQLYEDDEEEQQEENPSVDFKDYLFQEEV
ncbi:flagellar hook-length control protein FliK [Alkalibacillus haloalkaliphilus]|uniref:flagellar hook-length control protein FliK n=1 Tax=Alkalibacillus haloalkaliphilus TaxID=94136 RepID=UPI002935CAB5|nr:flagellar hook-length control protein FliK [Alkalibacillus haloalkaliphilus]MDV2580603.1 flagellar hook-length control protein FliK [Alkalibacillus haloalkaliphilus]